MQSNPYGPSSYSPPGPPAYSGPRIGEWLSEAFNLFGREWQTWCLQGLIATVILTVIASIGVGVSMAAFGISLQQVVGRGSEPSAAATQALIGTLVGAFCVTGFAILVPSAYLTAGMVRSAAKQLRGEPIAVGDLFSAGDVLLPTLGATLLVNLLVSLGSSLCYVPGLMLVGLLHYVVPLVVEGRMGVNEALSRSWNATKPFLWMNVLWYILCFVISSLGGLAGCGMIATLPIAILMLMIGYRDTIGIPGAIPPGGVGIPQQQPVYGAQYGAQYGPAGPPAAGGACPACGRGVAYGAVVCPYCQASMTQQPQPGSWNPPPPPPGPPTA